jgi:hypothetical protein
MLNTNLDFHTLYDSLSAYNPRFIKQHAVWAISLKNEDYNFHQYKILSALQLEKQSFSFYIFGSLVFYFSA